jgi:hypothetical protein
MISPCQMFRAQLGFVSWVGRAVARLLEMLICLGERLRLRAPKDFADALVRIGDGTANFRGRQLRRGRLMGERMVLEGHRLMV